jgi:hypothetical protein
LRCPYLCSSLSVSAATPWRRRPGRLIAACVAAVLTYEATSRVGPMVRAVSTALDVRPVREPADSVVNDGGGPRAPDCGSGARAPHPHHPVCCNARCYERLSVAEHRGCGVPCAPRPRCQTAGESGEDGGCRDRHHYSIRVDISSLFHRDGAAPFANSANIESVVPAIHRRSNVLLKARPGFKSINR